MAACVGRVLSEEARAAEPVPPFAKSPLDGYAFRTADLADASPENPVTLRVVEEIPRRVPSRPLGPGEAGQGSDRRASAPGRRRGGAL